MQNEFSKSASLQAEFSGLLYSRRLGKEGMKTAQTWVLSRNGIDLAPSRLFLRLWAHARSKYETLGTLWTTPGAARRNQASQQLNSVVLSLPPPPFTVCICSFSPPPSPCHPHKMPGLTTGWLESAMLGVKNDYASLLLN